MHYALIYIAVALVVGVFFARGEGSTDTLDVLAYAVFAPILVARWVLALTDNGIKWLLTVGKKPPKNGDR